MVSSDKEQTNQQKTMLKENKQLQRQITNNIGLVSEAKANKQRYQDKQMVWRDEGSCLTKNKQTNKQC